MKPVNEVIEMNDKDELLEELRKHVGVRNKMGGAMYWNILNDECCEIANRCAAAGVDRDTIGDILGKGNYC